ncbi:saccharopine dehydrogenase NADP-binding domain-containing protein [Vibrio sp. 1CM2L]|uniref:shikimate dehydrogenase family protein n=1 Tax=Vibrio sp. 1CM2L TaxID=2929166 RepID=UPI0020BD71BB|nr:saccharopine dehydrogenase NADP-binding domain-containing protein [Vibrio sp. 1CM2L]MCK8075679.1 saccharopine dehydrogenase NADP-binding domain-containing protein [Vibrio sp. 1CM2L]
MINCRLIGANIDKSKSPEFHNLLAEQLNIELDYQLNPLESGDILDFRAHSSQMEESNIHATNVTYPYKEMAVQVADFLDTSAKIVEASNTLVFRPEGTFAYNTDFSGFINAYHVFRHCKPGKTVLIGCGGVGKAVAAALTELETEHIALYDRDTEKMHGLAQLLEKRNVKVTCLTETTLEQHVREADGLLNCTPIGHYKTPGIPISSHWIENQMWVFDAVYTPIETEFIKAAMGANLAVLTGFELFFHQAVDAFQLFTDRELTPQELSQFRQNQFSNPV